MELDSESSGTDCSCAHIQPVSSTTPVGETIEETIFESVDDGILVVDIEHDADGIEFSYRNANSAFESMTGLSTADIRGKSPEDVLDESIVGEVRKEYRRCIDARETITCEATLDLPAGRKTFETKLTPLFEDGAVHRIVGVARDTTERNRRERELRRTKALLTDIEQTANVGAYEVNLETDDVRWTEGMRRLFEVDDDFEPTVRSSLEFFHPDDRDEIAELYRSQLDDGQCRSIEATVLTATGTERSVSAYGYVTDIDGTAYLRGYVRDITAEKGDERALRRSRDYLSKTEAITAIGGWEFDCRTNDLRWSAGTRAVFEVADDYQPTIADAIEFYHAEDRDRIRSLIDRCRTHGEPYDEILEVRTADGNQRWIRSLGEPVESKGDVVALRGAVLDVTEPKRREEQLQHYKRAIDASTDLIYAIDLEGEFRFANPPYCYYHGVDQDDIVGRSLGDILGESDYDAVQERLERAANGETVQYRTTRTHPTRGERTLDCRYYPYRDDGEITGIVAIHRDVTAREDRATQLQVVDRLLRHNIRNDLTVIRGRATDLTDAVPPTATDAAEEILEQTDDLLRTTEKAQPITNVLTADSERDSVDMKTLAERLADAYADWEPDADVTVTAPEPTTATAVPEFSRALEELVRNAIIHNDCDRPTVDIRIDQAPKEVRVSVLDDGPGIPETERNVLEHGKAPTDLVHGNGLGLWMVYWVVHRSGGELTVADRRSRGTSVTAHLPR
ncbi:PAS domain S-box protein [Salinadaptatus halalkaliphilus]|uniref:histidine kinase n=1 Tax=Salinadaptatus halalkaliphilus TaxID=2419781 RepID=A0A4S3TJY5_9EURY|nr:PAS domain S-box protein [Salinadaptatus halalkaliphilus]THE64394.1 PAS domain S-box protein [Salinadaptatus halalkaliphilus]